MRRRHWIASALVAGLSVPLLAWAGEDKAAAKVRSPEVQRIVSTAQEGSKVMEHLDVLCNRIGPRLTSSDNLTNACEWARDRFASFGIDNARLEEWGTFPVGFNRGPWFGRVVEPEPHAAGVGDHVLVGRHEGYRPGQGHPRAEGPEGARRGQVQGHPRRRLGDHAPAACGRRRPARWPRPGRSRRPERRDPEGRGAQGRGPEGRGQESRACPE